MATPIETVKAFLAEHGKGRKEGEAALRAYFTPDTVWEMVGVGTMKGAEEAIAILHKEYDPKGAIRLQVDILSIAASGNTVFTERVDRLITKDGRDVLGARMVGVFEVEGDRILATREY